MAKKLYLIDGHYQIYRSFYAAPKNLTSPSGEPTGAVHIFGQMLLNLIRDHKPDYLAVVMDVSDKTVFRCEIDRNYKANRDPAPEALRVQADRIVSLVGSMGIPIHRVEGFEADDLMATIAERLRDDPVEIYLVSRDKDLEQLLTDRVHLYDPTKDLVIDQARLLETKGYTPRQAVEVQTLAGDATDNVPGVSGVGVKTAAKWIAKYGTAQAVLEHADELTPKACANVKAFADHLATTRQLVTLRRDVAFEFELEACAVQSSDATGALALLDELGLATLKQRMTSFAAGTSSPRGEAKAAVTAISSPSEDQPVYVLVDTDAKLDALAEDLAKQPAFAFDTETTGLNPVAADLVGLSFSWQAGKAYYVPVLGPTGPVLALDTVVRKLKPVMGNPAIAKTGHNLKFDLLVLRQAGIHVAGPGFDTMLAHFLLDPLAGSHSLDRLAKTLLAHDMIPISDLIGKGKKQITIDQVDTKIVSDYAAEDADFTWRLAEVLELRIAGSAVEKLFRETEMPLVDVLVEMEHNGVAIDSNLLASLGDQMAARMVKLQREVFHAAGHEFNINSTRQLAGVLFDEQGLRVVRKTKTGRSTDADTLKTLAQNHDNPIPGLVLEYREFSKLKSTYVDTLPRMVCERTGRIHASFHQTGAVTGRLSSSDPNLQNIPIRTETGRQIRAAFVPGDPRSVLLVADYSQIELRLLAHFCQDDALLTAFRDGQDIHRAVAAQVNGVPLDEVTSAQRSAAKAVNFGIIYGQGAFGLSRSLGISLGEARVFIDMYFMRYPGIRLFIDQCIADAKQAGFAQTILGRRRPIPELQSRNRQQVSFGERVAVNTVVQGSAADLIKRAMINIHRELTTDGHGARMLSQVHDELVFEVPEEDVKPAAAMIREEMETAIPLDVPIVVDIAWGANWAAGK